jgi:putative ABC transport system permease protein
VLLARRPGVALALLAAALVAALPAAAASPFLSSAQHATLHRQIGATCPWLVGAQLTGPAAPVAGSALGPVVGAERFRGREAAVAANLVAGLTPPVSTGHGQVNAELVDRPLPFPDLRGLTLLARDGFADHVEVLDGPAGEGLWLPHERAQAQGIEVGDELRLTRRSREAGSWAAGTGSGGAEAAVTLPVAAIYRDLRASPDIPYWCGVAGVYRGSPDPLVDPPPPAVLLDTGTFLTVGQELQLVAEQVVEVALADPTPTAPEAARLAAGIEALRVTAFDGHPELFPTGAGDETRFVSRLDRYLRRAELVRSGLLPPVLPITAAGTLVALAVAAAAAVFWVQRRRQELAVLAAHGVGAGALGVKAAVEALPAVLAGAAAGWLAAWALVTGVGPSPVVGPGTLPGSAVAAAVTGLVALGLVGGLAAARARGLTDARPVSRGAGWWRSVPWELGLVAAAAAAWPLLAEARTVDPTAGGVGEVAHVPARLLVTPVLLVAGSALLAARIAARALRRHGLARTPDSPAWLLAWRRSARVATTTALLAAATAVPVAVATYAATATGSIRDTADAQLRFGLGSDTVLRYPRPIDRELEGLPPPPPVPGQLADHATELLRLNRQRLGGLRVDVLAVDPGTFAGGAFWDDRIPGGSLDLAVRQLTAGGTPVVVVSGRIAPGPATLTLRDQQIPVTVAGILPLPAAQPDYPLVLVHRGALESRLSGRALGAFVPEVWVAGDPDRARSLVTASGLSGARVTTVDDLRAGAVYEPVTYTFQYLVALSAFTGLIGAVGLLLHLESRITAHRRAYVLLRRLGLSAGAHRRALLLEVGAPVLAGLVAGIAGAVAVGYAAAPGFDLGPGRFPDTLLALPTTMAGAVAATVVVAATGAGLLGHARIVRANAGEVLRDAG